MQVHLRGADPARFPDIGNFTGMKDKGMLSSPQDAAAKVLAFLARPDFGSNPVADVRDA
jgi:benzil reductase ((S)-benzoin forming)